MIASTYTSNVTSAPTHNLPGRDFLRSPDETLSLLTDTPIDAIVADPNYSKRPSGKFKFYPNPFLTVTGFLWILLLYYRIYAENGAIPSKTPVTRRDPFLGSIKALSVPPPHTAKAVKHTIAKVENIKDRTSTILFLSPYSKSPMGDADKVNILSTGLRSTPQEPLALVAKISDSERSALEFERGSLASAAKPDTTFSDIPCLHYLLYADDYEMPSKVGIDPGKFSLGRIRADHVAPPHSPASIKRCISRVERISSLAHIDLFANTSCDTPLKEGYMSIFHTDGPGLSPDEPMAIVQKPITHVSIPDGKYVIKNRAEDVYWTAGYNPIRFFSVLMVQAAKNYYYMQWVITADTNGDIFIMTSAGPYSPCSWVGAEITASEVTVPWRLIPADSGSYYLTTDMDRVSQNPRVLAAAAQPGRDESDFDESDVPGSMATLEEGNQWQM